MSPEGNKILALCSQRLMATVVPALDDSFAQATVGLTNFLMTLVANEYERGADIRAAENNEIREIFAELTPLIADRDLKAKLAAAARERDVSLRISALNEANYALRRLLEQMQAHLEEQDGAKARAAEKRIWSQLKIIAARRVVSLAPAP